MNRKLFGKPGALAIGVIALAALTLSACERKIPGEPKKVIEDYIRAVQKGDFDTVYKINMVTARQFKWLSKSTVGDLNIVLKENFEKHKSEYMAATPSTAQGIRWAERFFFPASANVTVKEPHYLEPVGEDPVNAEYEKFTNVMAPVLVTYPSENDAPELHGKKVKSARYDCILRKIREGVNVTIYSHDDKWFFGGCVLEADSAETF